MSASVKTPNKKGLKYISVIPKLVVVHNKGYILVGKGSSIDLIKTLVKDYVDNQDTYRKGIDPDELGHNLVPLVIGVPQANPKDPECELFDMLVETKGKFALQTLNTIHGTLVGFEVRRGAVIDTLSMIDWFDKDFEDFYKDFE